jgi:protein tyrosine phosphatase (PTP) superfamily phosphohydrolase (DUF442 family)
MSNALRPEPEESDSRDAARRQAVRRLRLGMIVALGAVGALGVSLGVILPACIGDDPLIELPLPPNLHAVEPGRVYRSAQPTGGQLEAVVQKYGIRTVVNLRGLNTGKHWYDEEEEACRSLGVTLVNHAMSAKSLPSPELLGQVVETLKTADYPILMHCSGGADRTGAVAAIYRMMVLGEEKADAIRELSEDYLHFRWYAPCMDRLAELYEPEPDWIDSYAARYEQIDCAGGAAEE